MSAKDSPLYGIQYRVACPKCAALPQNPCRRPRVDAVGTVTWELVGNNHGERSELIVFILDEYVKQNP